MSTENNRDCGPVAEMMNVDLSRAILAGFRLHHVISRDASDFPINPDNSPNLMTRKSIIEQAKAEIDELSRKYAPLSGFEPDWMALAKDNKIDEEHFALEDADRDSGGEG